MSGEHPGETHAHSVRRTILILALAGGASAFTTRFVDPMIGVIARDLAADPLQVALLSTAYALPYAFIQPILGPVGDALGKERTTKICLAVLTVTLLGAALATSLPVLFVLRILSGAAAGGIIPLALATIGDRTSMAERQVAISRFLVFTISGQLVGSSLSGLLADLFGWREVFGLAAALAALATVSVVLGFRSASRTGGTFSVPASIRRYRQIVGISRARALMAFVFFEGIVIFGFQPYIAPLLELRGEGGAREAGIIIGGFAIGGIAYTLIVRLLLRTLGLGRMLAVAGLLGGAAYLVFALQPSWPVEAAAMVAVGMGFYMLHNSFQVQMSEVVPEARASAISLHAFAYFVGQAIGPVVFGYGLTSIGVPATLVLGALCIVALGFTAASVFGQPRAR